MVMARKKDYHCEKDREPDKKNKKPGDEFFHYVLPTPPKRRIRPSYSINAFFKSSDSQSGHSLSEI
jgi:hypothetical protein